MSWAIARKLAPFVIIALLAGAVLWLRGDITRIRAEREAAKVQVATVTKANETLARSLETVQQQRIDNDAIAAAVALRIGENRTVETRTNTIIQEKAANDPVTRDWLSVPVPDGVREALRSGANDGGAR